MTDNVSFSMRTITNESFLNVHEELKKEKVNNNAFFLDLHDLSLSGIDPHDPDLSDEVKEKIIKECENNFWYFIREVVRIPVSGGGEPVPFRLHKVDLSAFHMLLNNISIYLELPRQAYSSISMDTFALWEMLFKDDVKTMLGGIEKSNSVNRLYHIHDMTMLLPLYIREKGKFTLSDNASYTNHITNSVIRGLGNFSTGDKIRDKIRAMNCNRIMVEDFALTKFNYAMIENSENIRKVLISTIGETDSEEEKVAKSVIMNAIEFNSRFYDAFPDSLKYLIGRNSTNNIVYIKYDFTELKELDLNYFKWQCASLNYDIDKINRELLLIRQYTPVEQAVLKLRELHVSDRTLNEFLLNIIKE